MPYTMTLGLSDAEYDFLKRCASDEGVHEYKWAEQAVRAAIQRAYNTKPAMEERVSALEEQVERLTDGLHAHEHDQPER